ncbi:unnamed protein product [Spirodela intermedia]|uniref:FHA domain-containing protein n=1 Tax=Spirodela intermedia TaxID=51605 RepID=A0A7I8IPR6_SPIIN|nr:unnamed protein product [Spirodela intermedia]CAA6659888.1 unnamed protein product [Spirodela intermedia]
MVTAGGGDVEAGFAKLQGEDFEYYMQTYSILLGRNSKKSTVDVDLASLGGGMNISRVHARIFYDFPRRRFALEGVLHLPGNPPVKLDSQDLLQIGDKKFTSSSQSAPSLGGPPCLVMPPPTRHPLLPFLDRCFFRPRHPPLRQKKSEARSRVDREADNHQLLQLEEKNVVSSVATVLSDLCGPGEWMPMEKLHSELLKQYGNIWHHTRVRRYLTSEDWPGGEAKGRPWFGLLTLLRKYPEHFVINIRSRGRSPPSLSPWSPSSSDPLWAITCIIYIYVDLAAKELQEEVER